ncbi:hypothetical protein AAMO2058_001466500 [Amorphochlora amoebiformis]
MNSSCRWSPAKSDRKSTHRKNGAKTATHRGISDKEALDIAKKMRQKGFPAKTAGAILQDILPLSLTEVLPGKTQLFFVETSPVFENLAYLSLRRCRERLTTGTGYVLGANIPRLRELDASGCEVDGGFLTAILQFCTHAKTLTLEDSVIFGNQLTLKSNSLHLLTLTSDTCIQTTDAKKLPQGIPLTLDCPNLSQFAIDLSRSCRPNPKHKPSPSTSSPFRSPIPKKNYNGHINARCNGNSNSSSNGSSNSNGNVRNGSVRGHGNNGKSVIYPLVTAFEWGSVVDGLSKVHGLEYLAITGSYTKLGSSFFNLLSKHCPTLTILTIEGTTGSKAIGISHPKLSELTLSACPNTYSLTLDCPSLIHLAVRNCPIDTVDLHVPELRSLEMEVDSEESRVIAAHVIKASPNLYEFNGLPFDESHPDIPSVMSSTDWCAMS